MIQLPFSLVFRRFTDQPRLCCNAAPRSFCGDSMKISLCLRRLAAAFLLVPVCAGMQPVAAAERTQSANVVGVEALSVPSGVLSGTLGSWQKSVPPANGNPLYVTLATVIGTEDTDPIAATEWSAPAQVSEHGAPGLVLAGSVVVFLHQRGASEPAPPSGTFTYAFDSKVLSGGAFNGWSQESPEADGEFCWTIAATATNQSGTGTIPAASFTAAVKEASGCKSFPSYGTEFLFQRAASAPAPPGEELTYKFPSGLANLPRAVRGWMLPADDGNIYFTSSEGGDGYGTISRLAPDGVVAVVHKFKEVDDGYAPLAGLVQGSDGNLYGTTYYGGAKRRGTVFKLTLDGELTSLHEFNKNTEKGQYPYAGVVQGPDDNLYGTTRLGGKFDKGMVFRMATDGSGFSVLHSFKGSDGQDPQGQLVVDSDGQLYGTTMLGGAGNRGVIYRISTSGDFKRLYSFPKLKDFNEDGLATNATGANPRAGLLRTASGVFYGTAYQGGDHGNGTLFRVEITGDTAEVTPVHSFKGWPFNAGFPVAAVTQGPDGDFYGTSERGGYDDNGAVWRVAQDGSSSSLLHGYIGTATDGREPYAGVVFANDSLYAVSTSDNIGSSGAIIKLEQDDGGGLPVQLTTSATKITVDDSFELTWNAPYAITCDKFSSWNEAPSGDSPEHVTPTSGTKTLSPGSGIYVYGLACTDAANVTHNALVAVQVIPRDQISLDGGQVVGGGELSWLLLALLAALLFVKFLKERRSSCP
jgi:uncharacterized repeat protein (TIGR03803 family)